MGAIVVDSSALLAILFHEEDAKPIMDELVQADEVFLSTATYCETSIVFDRQKPHSLHYMVDELIDEIDAKIVPFGHGQAQISRQAYKDFGKGKHPAKLNMGDCFSYALSKEMALPLLYKGNDFAKTDIVSAL